MSSLDALLRHPLLLKPGGFEGFGTVAEKLDQYWPAVAEGEHLLEDVLRRNAAFDSGTPEAVAGQQLVASVNGLLRFGAKLAPHLAEHAPERLYGRFGDAQRRSTLGGAPSTSRSAFSRDGRPIHRRTTSSSSFLPPAARRVTSAEGARLPLAPKGDLSTPDRLLSFTRRRSGSLWRNSVMPFAIEDSGSTSP